MLIGISILLENATDINYYLKQMLEDDREKFKKFPIYNLVKEYNMVIG